MNDPGLDEMELPLGLDYLVNTILIKKERMNIFGDNRAKGIFLIGPSGTGKTMLARSTGRLVNLPVVEFKISSLLNPILGETKSLLIQALANIQALAPNIVIIDEIEKFIIDPTEHYNSTLRQCTGILLNWFKDNPYPNFVISIASDIRNKETSRLVISSNRFDECFFVDLPNLDTRKLMLERWLEGEAENLPRVAQEVAEMTNSFSGADLKWIVKEAKVNAKIAQVRLSMDFLISAVERMRMRALSVFEKSRELRRWGRIFCRPAGPTDF